VKGDNGKSMEEMRYFGVREDGLVWVGSSSELRIEEFVIKMYVDLEILRRKKGGRMWKYMK
jgi:hypothetical protein